MTIARNLIAALALVIASQALAQDQPLIVGGTVLKDQSKVPFLVQLHDQYGVACGGTVIAPTWILSAAHCEEVINEPALQIFAGSIVAGQGSTLKVKNHYVHPQFSGGDASHGPSNDFMLIELTAPITDAKVQAIALADADFVSRGGEDPGQVLTVAGWGDLKENSGKYPSTAYSVDVPVVSLSVANASAAYNGVLDESMLPAGYAQGKKDACDGDSGGPLFTYDSQKQQNVLVGVVSWGDGCARANKYGIYSNVAYGLDWIQQTMGKTTSPVTKKPKPSKISF